MTGIPTRNVPVGIGAGPWLTVRPERTVLLVVHNITTLTRLLDILGLFQSDRRIQIVATNGADPFSHGLEQALEQLGIITISWEQARQNRFDLIISASHHGNLTDLHGPITILSHGAGYTKNSPGARSQEPGARSQEPGARSQEPGARSQEPGARSVFGLSPQWLLYDGKPIAESLVLSHEEQLDRLNATVPEAAHTATVAGDPCYDRIRASVPFRRDYRAMFGADDRHQVIAVSSTWSASSLLGSSPALLTRLTAELPIDSTRIVAIAHPNIWHGHGPWQLRCWLADCVRAGLVLVPELEGWRAALIAADCVIGDNGSVTCYGAAIGRPVLLGAFPEDEVAAGSPVDVLGRLAPRLDLARSPREQIETAISTHSPDRYEPVRRLISSVPDESPQRLRALFYRLLDLAEPDTEPMLSRIPVTDVPVSRVSSAVVGARLADGEVRLTRYAAEVQPTGATPTDAGATHLVAHVHHPGRLLRGNADIVYAYDHEVTDGLELLLSTNPGCGMAAMIGDAQVTVRLRNGDQVELRGPASTDPTAWASALFAWLDGGRSLADLAPTVTVVIGGERTLLTVRIS